MVERFWIEWTSKVGLLRVIEPTPEELRIVAPALAAAYDEPHNRAMMAHEEPHSPEQVVEHYEGHAAAGGRAFLLYLEDTFMGDADLRHMNSTRAEFAIMVGPRGSQGKGLGTRFATMIHVLAFAALRLRRLYISVVPGNAASLRLFEKLGYTRDDSDDARSFADDASDLCLSISREEFAQLHGDALSQIRFGAR